MLRTNLRTNSWASHAENSRWHAPLILLALWSLVEALPCGEAFVRRNGDRLFVDRDGDGVQGLAEPLFRFVGATQTDIMYYGAGGADSRAPDPFEIEDGLITMQQLGQTAVRTYVFATNNASRTNEPVAHILGIRRYAEDMWRRYDLLLARAAAHQVRIVQPIMDKYWYFGGFSEFAAFRGKAWSFSDAGLRQDYKDLLTDILNRRNHLTGIRYKDDPTILAWQLGNESDEIAVSSGWEAEMAAHIKSIAPRTLVFSGRYGVSPISLTDPNIDGVDCHFYPPNAASTLNAWNAAKGKRPLMIGEFSAFFVQENATSFLNATAASGFLYWAMIPHSRNGGYRMHPENNSGSWSRLHWPHWDTTVDLRPETMTILQDTAFLAAGRSAPTMRVPVPGFPPVLLPILDPAVSGLRWRGVAGARWYHIERGETATGPWTRIGTGVSDLSTSTMFLDPAASAAAPWYRVQAGNDAGVSGWSNVVKKGDPHPLSDLTGNLLVNGSFESGLAGWTAGTTYAAVAPGFLQGSGTASMLFSNAATNNQQYPGISQVVQLKTGTEYRLSFKVKGQPTDTFIKILPTTGAPILDRRVRSRYGEEDVYYFNSGNHTQVTVYLGIKLVPATAWFDDFMLVENTQVMTLPPTIRGVHLEVPGSGFRWSKMDDGACPVPVEGIQHFNDLDSGARHDFGPIPFAGQ